MKIITITYETDNEAMQEEIEQQAVIKSGLTRLFESGLDKLNLYDYNGNKVGTITTS